MNYGQVKIEGMARAMLAMPGPASVGTGAVPQRTLSSASSSLTAMPMANVNFLVDEGEGKDDVVAIEVRPRERLFKVS